MPESLHKDTILQKLSDRKQQLPEFGVMQIRLFGSFLRKENKPDSDIDLLVDLKLSYKTFRNFMALNYYLEDLFRRKVELVTKQSLSPYPGPHILKTVEYASIAG